jgi:hypothetical protein
MNNMKVHDTVFCESQLISKQDISYKLLVYNVFCKKLEENTTLSRWSRGVGVALAECGGVK